MPDRDVRTLRDLIWYQYAKIIAKSALGPEAKRDHYGFVKQTLRDLQSGKKQWSDISREDWQLVEAEKRCVYCGATDTLSREHLVPKTLRINDRCPACDVIQSIHNQIWSGAGSDQDNEPELWDKYPEMTLELSLERYFWP